ncbi:mechanosensitive ion channel [Thiotrichales bacterium 19X7-9]|nr:mechanosensitive ion channel [Thiotrichales bacterium 19X7-9]
MAAADPTVDTTLITKEYILNSSLTIGSNLLYALIIFIVGIIVAKFIRYLVKKLMIKAQVEPILTNFIARILFYTVIILALIAALSKLGVPTASMIGVFTASVFAIAFALRNSLNHFASGMILAATRPFHIGDFIDINKNASGTVKRITLFFTEIMTTENQKVTIPNGNVLSSTITNFSFEDKRRTDLIIGIGYGDDINKAKQILVTLLNQTDSILNDPQPVVVVNALSSSSVDLLLRYWTMRADAISTKWALLESAKNLLDENHINIPFPQTDVHLYKH